MSKKLLRFFEYEKLHFNRSYKLIGSDKEFFFCEKYRTALEAFYTLSDGAYYSLIATGIQFCEQVGAIQVLDLTIEVLPKIDKSEKDVNKWHDVLLNMLKECRLLLPESCQHANLQLNANSIFELYFQKYIVELEYLLHTGLVKKYRKIEGNQKALKGALVFAKQLQVNLVHAERFYTRHSTYGPNHLLHQILRQALEVIDKIGVSLGLRDRLKNLLLEWPESKRVKISQGLFSKLSLDRKTQPYKEAVGIARLILLNYHPDIKGGGDRVLALMFNMNSLWEEFIFRRLKYAGPKNWEVHGQKGLYYWAGAGLKKRLIPDIIVMDRSTNKKVVIDTKWKRLQANKPDDQDLRQLLTYKLYFHSDQAFLLYPDHSYRALSGEYSERGFGSDEFVFRQGIARDGGLLFANVLDDGGKLLNRKKFLESSFVKHLSSVLTGSETN